MISKVEHIGIIVTDLNASIQKYTRLLGLEVASIEEFEEDGTRARLAFLPVGESCIELVEITQTPDGKKPPPGVEHIAVAVSDIEDACGNLRAQGATLQPDAILPGSRGTRVAFIRPADFDGVSIELVEAARA